MRACTGHGSNAQGRERIVRTHRSGHIARHATVVFAGAASLTLTVIAGSYIVHQIADVDRPSIAAPATPPTEDSATDPSRTDDTVLTASGFELPALFALHRPGSVVDTPQADSGRTAQTGAPAPTTLSGKLLLGNAYVDAQVANGQHNTVTLTLGTNAFTVLAAGLSSDPVQDDHPGTTRLHTELDTRTGEVVLVLTDSAHGERNLRLQRYPAPKSGTTEPTVLAQPAPDTPVEPAPSIEI
jgi:hypothetical protein